MQRGKVSASKRTSRLAKVLFCSSLTSSRQLFQTLSQGLLAFREEALPYIARIKVISDDRTCGIEAIALMR
jgi:hypothetical protein